MYTIDETTKNILTEYVNKHWEGGGRIFDTLLNNHVIHLQTEQQKRVLSFFESNVIPVLLSRVVVLLKPLSSVIGIQPLLNGFSNSNILFLQVNHDNSQIDSVFDNDPLTQQNQRITIQGTSHSINEKDVISSDYEAVWPDSLSNNEWPNSLSNCFVEETILALSQEIVSSIVAEVISKLMDPTQDEVVVKSSDYLKQLISAKLNGIARDTRRGAGNFLITSPAGLACLMFPGDRPAFIKTNEDDHIQTFSLQHVGYLNSKCISVFVSHLVPDDIILIGYTSKTTQTDTGLVWSPKNLIVEKEKKIEDNVLQTVISKEDTFTFNNSDFCLGLEYYRTIKFKPSF